VVTKLNFLSTKFNVLFLCGWYPSKVSPTNGDFIQRHAEAVALNHKVTVIHIITDKENKEHIEFTNETINGIETHIAYIKYTANPIKKIFFYIRAFKTLLQKTGSIDIVHLNQTFPFGIFSLYLKWFKKIPFIISEHYTGYLKSSNSKITFFQKQVSKCIVRKSSFFCPVSNYLYKDLMDLGFKGNYEIVPNIIDTELFIPVKKEDSFLKLIHISSLKDEHKNIKGMLRVAKLLSKNLDFFEWNFIGNSGDEYKEYINELDIKKCKISFLEHQSHSKIIDHLQKASVCVSFSNYETFGIVIPEAIACGTPVISTNTGIALDFKNLPFCKIIPIKNEQLLLDSILNYKPLFADLDIANMHTFVKQKFNKKVISSKFSLLYYESLKR
tara:strand:- start:5173 stop:6327 length:1155 start_codon:yes stop_codon:yes gene_type:complete